MKMIERLRANAWPIAVIVLSVIAHTWQLGRRAMAHDEAIDAWFSWQARGTGIIKYDPVYHGPLRFYLEGFVLDHFGITPGWTRAIAALAGIGATIVIAVSRSSAGTVRRTLRCPVVHDQPDHPDRHPHRARRLVDRSGLVGAVAGDRERVEGAAPTTHRRRWGTAGGQLHAEGDDVHLRIGGSLLLRRPRRGGARSNRPDRRARSSNGCAVSARCRGCGARSCSSRS